MTTSVIKPKPGIYNGVKYRSQLEIAWAKWFHSHTLDNWAIEYMDEHDFDFLMTCRTSDIGWHTIEIKPPVYSVCANAIKRLNFSGRKPGDRWSLVVGNPPSPYGMPLVLQFKFCTASHVYGPWSGLSAYITHGCLELEQNGCVPPLVPLKTHLFDTWVIPVDLWDEYCGDGDMQLVDGIMAAFSHTWKD